MDPDERKDVRAYFLRLLRESRENDARMFESTKKAIDESRELLERVARDHPEID